MGRRGYSLRRDKRGRWVATVSIKGKRHYRVIGGGSQRVAEALAAEYAAELRAAHQRPDPKSMSEMCDRWLTDDQERSAHYAMSSRRVIDGRIRPALGHITVDKLRRADVDAMLAALTARGLAPATVRQTRAVLQSVLRLAEREDLVTRNVARLASVPRQRQAPHRLPTADAVSRAVNRAWATSPMAGALIELAAVTGARRGELVAVRWADIDLGYGERHPAGPSREAYGGVGHLGGPAGHSGTITVTGSLTTLIGGTIERGPTKTRQTRTLALGTSLTERLAAEHARQTGVLGQPPTWLAWSDPAGTTPWHPDRLSKLWMRIRAAVPGLDGIRLHDLRHWVGSELIEAGESLVSAAAQLGHASTAMLGARYAHPVAEATHRRAEIMAGRLTSQRPATP